MTKIPTHATRQELAAALASGATVAQVTAAINRNNEVNTYHCTECGVACEETCRDCGTDADVIEICGGCREWLDNCTCAQEVK